MHSIKCVQGALLFLVITELLHISWSLPFGQNRVKSSDSLKSTGTISIDVTGYWLRSKLDKDMGTSWYLLIIYIQQASRSPILQVLYTKKFYYLKLKAPRKYRMGSICLDAYSTYFMGSVYKTFPRILLDFFFFKWDVIFAFFLAAQLFAQSRKTADRFQAKGCVLYSQK